MKFLNLLPRTEETCFLTEHLEILPDRNHYITDDDLAAVLPHCPNIETAILTGVSDLSDRTVTLLARETEHLKAIDLSGCQQISNVSIFELSSQATSLESIKLNNLPSITDPAISSLTLSLAHLTVLELCNSPFLTASSVRDIWSFARKLTKLRLARCSHITDKGFPTVLVSAPPSAGLSFKEVRAESSTRSLRRKGKLPMRGSAIPGLPSSSDLFHLDDVQPQQRPLSWLDIIPPLVLPAHHLFEDLRHLDLSYCFKLTDNAIAGIVAHAPKIQQLFLTGCVELTNRSLESIAKLGMWLDVLNLGHVEKITDLGVVNLVRACTRLKSVDISCKFLLDFSLLCSEKRLLIMVSVCSKLTDLSVLELSALQHLRRLSIVGLQETTDNAILFLAEHTPTLKRLHVSQCPRISLEAIHTMIAKLPNLEHLSASGLPSLKRIGVQRFSDVAPSVGNACVN